MRNNKDGTVRAMIEVFRHAYSPRELFNHLTMILMKEPPRRSLPMIAKVFDDCGFQKPIDWFAWATNGQLTDAEVLEWDNLVPKDAVAVQPRRSKRLAVGANGWIAHPTQMEAWGEPIRFAAMLTGPRHGIASLILLMLSFGLTCAMLQSAASQIALGRSLSKDPQ